MTSLNPRRLGLTVARAAAFGALTLIDPNKLSGVRKHLYWLATGAVAAAESLVGDEEEFAPEARPALAVGIAGATYGARDVLAKGDAWSMRLMHRIGVRHPRRWFAGLAVATSLGASLYEVRQARLRDAEAPTVTFDPQPVPTDIAAIVSALLQTVDDYGSTELRAQLADARCVVEDGVVTFLPHGESPRALVDYYTFPATGTFERDGRTHVITLNIEDGALGFLSQYVEPDWVDGDPEPDWSWPVAAEVTCAVGTH